ncbi:hypothetical protein C2E23DRAFT_863939 [Lenzites betulinus]|nr:hypothetical protein C2E23DRAFT_863939 [Lenzites betulinus]
MFRVFLILSRMFCCVLAHSLWFQSVPVMVLGCSLTAPGVSRGFQNVLYCSGSVLFHYSPVVARTFWCMLGMMPSGSSTKLVWCMTAHLHRQVHSSHHLDKVCEGDLTEILDDLSILSITFIRLFNVSIPFPRLLALSAHLALLDAGRTIGPWLVLLSSHAILHAPWECVHRLLNMAGSHVWWHTVQTQHKAPVPTNGREKE